MIDELLTILAKQKQLTNDLENYITKYHIITWQGQVMSGLPMRAIYTYRVEHNCTRIEAREAIDAFKQLME